MRARAYLPVLVAALGGCTLGPDYERPELETPPTYIQPVEQGESFANTPWWDLFQDEQLRDLVRIALEENQDLGIAIARIEEFRAILGVTRADQFPTVDITASGGRTDPSQNTIQGSISDGFNDSYRLSGDVFFELDLFGRLRRSTEAARGELLAAEESRRSITISLIANVASTYMLLRDLDAQLEIARRTEITRTDSLGIIEARFEKGTVPRVDVNQAEIELAVASAAVAAAERQVAQTEHALSLLLGRNPGPIVRGLPLEQQAVPPDIPAGLPSELLQRRPDVLASEATLKANMMRAERDFLQRQGREVRGAARVDARGAPAHRTFVGTDEEHAAAVRMQRIQRGRAARDRVKAMRRERASNREASNRARDDARVRHDAAARIQAAVRAKTARERVGKMRADERVAAARARVARNAAAERAARWREPEPSFESPYLHSAASSREATPVKSRPASASSQREAAATTTQLSTTTTTAVSPSGRRPASGITFPGEDDHVRRMRAFRERVEAKANAIGALPARRTRAAPPPKPSPAKSILKSPADRPRSSPGAIESASPRRGFLDDDDALVQSAGAPSPGDAHRATPARPREARRSLRVSFELAEDRERQEDSPATLARKAELAMDERFRPRVQRDAVAAARDAERARHSP